MSIELNLQTGGCAVEKLIISILFISFVYWPWVMFGEIENLFYPRHTKDVPTIFHAIECDWSMIFQNLSNISTKYHSRALVQHSLHSDSLLLFSLWQVTGALSNVEQGVSAV
jgi:hypothetical protein